MKVIAQDNDIEEALNKLERKFFYLVAIDKGDTCDVQFVRSADIDQYFMKIKQITLGFSEQRMLIVHVYQSSGPPCYTVEVDIPEIMLKSAFQ